MGYYYNKKCKYCGDYSYGYDLCKDCYQMAQNGEIEEECGCWIPVQIKDNRFYDPNKSYYLKKNILNSYEERIFNIVNKKLRGCFYV